MALMIHTLEVADLSSLQNTDRAVLAQQDAIPFTSSGSAGAQTLAITFGTSSLPSTYSVVVGANQACFTSVTGKTNSGFNIVVTPVLAASTLATGTFDVIVIG